MAKNSKSKSDEVLAQQLAEQGVTTTSTETTATSGVEAGMSASGTEDASPTPAPDAPKRRGRPAGSTNKPKDPNAPPKVTTPRVRVPAGTKPSEVLALHVPNEVERAAMMRLTSDAIDEEENQTIVAGIIDKLAKKVGEKAVNLLRHSTNRDRVQVYTQIGLDMLLRDGKITSKGLVDGFSKTKYRIGTARAQGNQLMQLFPALKITVPGAIKGELVPNDKSVLLRNFSQSVSQPKVKEEKPAAQNEQPTA